jgi:NADH-quinone oxidoreductase subunit D
MTEQNEARSEGAQQDELWESMTLNIGPSHPATHGTLHLLVELDGEVLKKITPKIGYLHRGCEKLAENLAYHQFTPHTDRLNYLSPPASNVAYAMAVEKLLGIEIPPRAEYMRVILAELSRISDHLVWLGCTGIDLGALTLFLWTFRSRERIYEIFENVTGQRMHTAWTRIGGMPADLPEGFKEQVTEFIDTFPPEIDEYERLVTQNRIWIDRNKGIAVLTKEDAISYGLSGPPVRGSGVEYDLRRTRPYSVYPELDFEIPLGTHGDAYDRFLVRVEEMRQSTKIVRQALEKMPEGPIIVDDPRIAIPPKEAVYNEMEALIYHFKFYTDGIQAPAGEIYEAIEVPNGELGFYIISDGSGKPYRLKIRSPSFANYSCFPEVMQGHMISDFVAGMSSFNIIAGELDR